MTVFLAWMLADFISGLGHWFQDRVLTTTQKIPFLEAIRQDNELHHTHPYAMSKHGTWQTINTSAAVSWPVAIILYLFGAPTVLWLAVFFASFANLVHKYAHKRPTQRNWVILFMQCIGLFGSFTHRHVHHYGPSGTIPKNKAYRRYCVMTDWLNIPLDAIKFWAFLEFIFLRRKR